MCLKLKDILCRRISVASKVAVLFLSCVSQIAYGVSFDCDRNQCGLQGDGTYPNLVLGTVRKVADETEANAVYHWAKHYGYWAELPDDQKQFTRLIKMLSVEIPGRYGVEEVTLLMGREHYDSIEIRVGDLVRYRPHETDASRPASADEAARPFWNLFGCIAVLCRGDDSQCPDRYSTGIYRVTDGIALNQNGDAPAQGVKRIDPVTYFPLQSWND
jgi:hypothetical protein